jgi:DNA polymerase III delta subunit
MNWDIQKVAKARVVLITGGEDVLRIQLIRELREAIGAGEDDFDSESCLGDERSILDWIGSVSTTPFLADRRTLFVRAVYRADTSLVKKNPLLDIPETGRLILIAEEDGGSDERNTKQKKQETTWTKWVQEAKGMVVSCAVNDSDLAPTLQKAAKSREKKITK